MNELFDWIYRNKDIIWLIIIGYQIIKIVVFIELIRAIFAISRNTATETENIRLINIKIAEMQRVIEAQSEELLQLTTMQNELLSIEIREQRFMNGYPTNRRLDEARPDE